MGEADRERWNARHAARPWTGALPPLVARAWRWLPRRGRALDVACGDGALAVWLARQGWRVDALDISDVALARVRCRAQRVGIPCETFGLHAAPHPPESTARPAGRVHLHRWDLDEGLPPHLEGPWDLVACLRYRDPRLLDVLTQALAPGGLLLIEWLAQCPGHPHSPHRAAAGELGAWARAQPLHILDLHDTPQTPTGTWHLVARRPPPEVEGPESKVQGPQSGYRVRGDTSGRWRPS